MLKKTTCVVKELLKINNLSVYLLVDVKENSEITAYKAINWEEIT